VANESKTNNATVAVKMMVLMWVLTNWENFDNI